MGINSFSLHFNAQNKNKSFKLNITMESEQFILCAEMEIGTVFQKENCCDMASCYYSILPTQYPYIVPSHILRFARVNLKPVWLVASPRNFGLWNTFKLIHSSNLYTAERCYSSCSLDCNTNCCLIWLNDGHCRSHFEWWYRHCRYY